MQKSATEGNGNNTVDVKIDEKNKLNDDTVMLDLDVNKTVSQDQTMLELGVPKDTTVMTDVNNVTKMDNVNATVMMN